MDLKAGNVFKHRYSLGFDIIPVIERQCLTKVSDSTPFLKAYSIYVTFVTLKQPIYAVLEVAKTALLAKG